MTTIRATLRTVAKWTPRMLTRQISRFRFALTEDLQIGLRLIDEYRRIGNEVLAREISAKCISVLDTTSLLVRRRWFDFEVHRRWYELGNAPLVDPLFECKPRICGDASSDGSVFSTKFFSGGLLIKGKFDRSDADNDAHPETARLMISGTTVRTFGLKFRNGTARFRFAIKRNVLATFPKIAELQILAADGGACTAAGRESIKLSVPHGAGTLEEEVRVRGELNKKGRFKDLPTEVAIHQQRLLKLYDSVRTTLEKRRQMPLLLLFGTLLGQHRESDLIPWDDDFDVGYLSVENSPVGVKDEAKGVIETLLSAGFDVVINKRLRMPFWVRARDGLPDEHLSVAPVWQQDGCMWAEIKACWRLKPEDFKVEESLLRNTIIYKPVNTDAVLAEYYGPDWRRPDPTYTNSTFPAPIEVLRNLAKSAFTEQDVIGMKDAADRMRGENPEYGRLLCSSLVGLYPLDTYESVFGW